MQADCNCFQGWGKQKALFTAQWFVNNEWQITVFAHHQMVGDSRRASDVESKWDLSQAIRREYMLRFSGNQRETESKTLAENVRGKNSQKEKMRMDFFILVFINSGSFWGKMLDESHRQLWTSTWCYLCGDQSLHTLMCSLRGKRPIIPAGSWSLSQQWCQDINKVRFIHSTLSPLRRVFCPRWGQFWFWGSTGYWLGPVLGFLWRCTFSLVYLAK